MLTGAAVVAVAAAGVVVGGRSGAAPSAGQARAAATAAVERGRISAVVSQTGILTYRARPDGSPFAAINHARGTYTWLPAAGHRVACGGVLYRVDDRPILLLCGTVPAYRALREGDTGADVLELNRAVHAAAAGRVFTARTRRAVEAMQRRRGLVATGSLALGDAVFLPGTVRIAKVTGQLGGAAQPGAPLLTATSGTLHVLVNFEASQQGQVKLGDPAQITLPGNATTRGSVAGFGRIAETPAAQGVAAADATIPTSVSLDDPRQARGLDRAPVQVDIRTGGVEDALSVPVTALVGKAGGGLAVERVRAAGQRDLVAVRVGLFDTADGRVQVDGDLRVGDRVVVPSL